RNCRALVVDDRKEQSRSVRHRAVPIGDCQEYARTRLKWESRAAEKPYFTRLIGAAVRRVEDGAGVYGHRKLPLPELRGQFLVCRAKCIGMHGDHGWIIEIALTLRKRLDAANRGECHTPE